MSNEHVRVRSANGQIEKKVLTKYLMIEDPETGRQARASLVVASNCPFNLLGRDVMVQLGIGILPNSEGGNGWGTENLPYSFIKQNRFPRITGHSTSPRQNQAE